MTIKIEGRTIIIVGPKSTGKTGVAKDLIFQNPIGSGICVPYKLTHATPKSEARYKQGREKLIAEAIKNENFLIVDCEGVSVEDVKAIIELCKLKSLFRKIQVIKMNLTEELHEEFCRHNHEPITRQQMLEERKMFEGILNTDFEDLNVIQTELHNPENAEYVFEGD